MSKGKRKKKIGSVKRFGPRYGTRIRDLVQEIEKKERKSYECPNCGAMKVKRVSSGIWKCRRCDVKFTGKAYSPEIGSSELIKSMRKPK